VDFTAKIDSKEVVKLHNKPKKQVMFSAKIVPLSTSLLHEILTTQTYHLYLLKLVLLSIGLISFRQYFSVSAID
jgi:hypothetical protein